MINSIIRTLANNSIADAVYREINNRSTRFYHYYGRTNSWYNDLIPEIPQDSISYEKQVRDEIIIMKEISPADVAYVIPRIDWVTGTVYDQYDDSYSKRILGVNITDGGTGYTTHDVVIGTDLPVSTAVTVGTQYFHTYGGTGYLYTVKTLGTTAANHTAFDALSPITIGTIYTHGTATLECVGFQAKATAYTDTSGTYNTKVTSVQMTDYGSGYTYAPAVTFSGGTGATATAVMAIDSYSTYSLPSSKFYVFNASNNNIYICLDNNKGGQSTVAPTGLTYVTTADGYTWKYVASVSATSKFTTSAWLPIFTYTKNKYSPTGSIVSVRVDSGGSGYTSPSITINGDGSGASLAPQVTNGTITGVTINNAGTNYSYINLVITDSTGTGASISASLFTGIVNDSAQELAESNTIAGEILSIPVVSGGKSYTTATVTITGDGSGATATATISSGRISKINIVTRGSNYNWATITITGDGYGASARAVLSPSIGLGKDPVNDLFARALMFYSSSVNGTVQGITLTNDYRQYGIIKDPTRYSDNYYLTANFATACWYVKTSSLVPSTIYADDIVTAYSNSVTYSFRVEYINGQDVLLIPINNGVPISGMQFSKGSVYFTASSVVPPNVNKYSGDLMTINNQNAMSGIVRTVINL